MHVNELRLFNFRNLKDAQYKFSPGVTCLTGKNGQGKTNLIEAIALLSLTRSFRTATIQDLVAWEASACSVFASCSIGGSEREIGLSIEHKSKQAFLDGRECKSVAQLFGVLVTVSFSPTDISLVQGPPLGRRRFIDRHIVDRSPRSVETYVQYQKALKSKQALLKQGVTNRTSYGPWNELVAKHAAMIYAGRANFLSELSRYLAPVSNSLFGDDSAIGVRLRGALAGTDDDEEISISESDILERINSALPREISQQRALVGPHRDDLSIDLFGHSARSFASQGQARSIVLALKAAIISLLERERGEPPVILLDDVDSELDLERRIAIFRNLISPSRQVLITSTEYRLPPQIQEIVSEVLVVNQGTVGRVENSV